MAGTEVEALQAFRAGLYGCLGRRRDALFEVLDALLAAGPCPSLPHLSLAPGHRRGWGSVYAALRRGHVHIEALRALLLRQPMPEGPPLYAVDVSVWPRAAAATSPERGYQYHSPRRRRAGGDPVVPGWAYQWLVRLGPTRDSWTAPVDVLGLVAKAAVWYLVALAPPAGAVSPAAGAAAPPGPAGPDAPTGVRVFRVTRLADATIVDDAARRPEGFDLAAFWAHWCAQFEAGRPRYPVALRVAPDFVHVLPRILGEGVRATVAEAAAEGDPDHRGWLLVPLSFENLETACVRVLGFGAAVEVVGPQELRLRVAEQARAIAARYDAPLLPRPDRSVATGTRRGLGSAPPPDPSAAHG